MTDEILKKCPICGSEPRGIFYTSYPPQYGFSHCGIESGCCKSMHEAKEKWNEQVYLYQQKQNKLTDEQIVKALEFCSSSDLGECKSCPFYEQCENDELLAKYTLDLINRQSAEIDELKKENEGWYRLHKINRDLMLQYDDRVKELKKKIQTAKSEAMKEFIEWLQENGHINFSSEMRLNLVKEMVGD